MGEKAGYVFFAGCRAVSARDVRRRVLDFYGKYLAV